MNSSALSIEKRRPLLAVLAIFAVFGMAVTALGVASSASAATVSGTDGLSYVALGDSYSAGLGTGTLTGTPVPGCGQSDTDYPHQLASSLGLTLTDVTCSGASTANGILGDQVTGAGTAAAQIGALSSSTDVVTITIGGNDLGFTTIASTCAAVSATGPLIGDNTKSDCSSDPSAALIVPKIAFVVQPALKATFAAIKSAAPNAKVFVLGYPSITPDAANMPVAPDVCFTTFGTPPSSFPYTTTDVPFLHSIETALDAAIQAEALTASFTYVPSFANSVAHSACGSASPYINGIIFSGGSVVPNSLHPNVAGIAFMASQASAAIVSAFPDVTTADPVTPTVPAAAPAAPILPVTGASPELLVGGGILALLLIAVGSTALVMSRRKQAKVRD